MFGKCELKPAKKLKKVTVDVPIFKHTTTIEFRKNGLGGTGRANFKIVGTDHKTEAQRKVSLMPHYSNWRHQDKYRDKYESVEVTEVFVTYKAPSYLNQNLCTIVGDDTTVNFMMNDVMLISTVKEKVGEVRTVRYEAV
jgi:hypothetical protein